MNYNCGDELYAKMATMKGYELFVSMCRKHRKMSDKEICELLGACIAADMHPFLVGVLLHKLCVVNDTLWNSRMGAAVGMSCDEFVKQHQEFTRKVFCGGFIDED